jgi:hypothetical protein
LVPRAMQQHSTNAPAMPCRHTAAWCAMHSTVPPQPPPHRTAAVSVHPMLLLPLKLLGQQQGGGWREALVVVGNHLSLLHSTQERWTDERRGRADKSQVGFLRSDAVRSAFIVSVARSTTAVCNAAFTNCGGQAAEGRRKSFTSQSLCMHMQHKASLLAASECSRQRHPWQERAIKPSTRTPQFSTAMPTAPAAF